MYSMSESGTKNSVIYSISELGTKKNIFLLGGKPPPKEIVDVYVKLLFILMFIFMIMFLLTLKS